MKEAHKDSLHLHKPACHFDVRDVCLFDLALPSPKGEGQTVSPYKTCTVLNVRSLDRRGAAGCFPNQLKTICFYARFAARDISAECAHSTESR